MRFFCRRPKWVTCSQHCRLCSGSNQPPLTHHPGYSPSTQAPSLSSSDNPIMQSPIDCPVVPFVNFRRWCAGTQFRDSGAPKWEPSETTHVHTRARPHLHPRIYVGNGPSWEVLRGQVTLYDTFPPPPLLFSYPKYLASTSISRVLLSTESPFPPFPPSLTFSSLLNFAVRSRSRRISYRGFYREAITSWVSVSIGLSEELSMVYTRSSGEGTSRLVSQLAVLCKRTLAQI